jgi:two-component system chemotaxis response regulator CheB
MIESDPTLTVVGEAKNGAQAVQMAQALRPDVITMDVEMPEMDGLQATRQIIASAPCIIIMVSSLTERGTRTTLDALQAGAVDFISKKSSFVQLDIMQISNQLVEKIHFWVEQMLWKKIKPQASAEPSTGGRARLLKPVGKVGLVVVGVSTGGPAMMHSFLRQMGPLSCPMVIAQHMPPVFTKGFADHLLRETGLNVIEGKNGMKLEPGMVVIAPGGTDSIVREPFAGEMTLYLRTNTNAPIHPNADELFKSAAAVSVGVVGVILTGMGNDGTAGAKALAASNAPVLVQEPATCIVDGMPGSAIQAGVVNESLSPQALAKRLAVWCN